MENSSSSSSNNSRTNTTGPVIPLQNRTEAIERLIYLMQQMLSSLMEMTITRHGREWIPRMFECAHESLRHNMTNLHVDLEAQSIVFGALAEYYQEWRHSESTRLAPAACGEASLEDVVVGEEKAELKSELCAICVEELGSQVMSKMPCSHVFHKHCILEWFRVNRVCPFCRFKLPTQ